MLPRFYLWVLAFLLGMTIYWADKIAWKLLRYDKKSRDVRQGSCQKTGMCCRDLSIEIPESWARCPWLREGIRRWYRFLNNFQPVGTLHGRLLVFSCGYLTKENTCGIYPFRPKICREYPAVTLFGHANLHKGCGFWFIERAKLGSFEEKLKLEEHQQERVEYLSQL
jgi:Fe-S-cluster containining protein